jgi:peptidoglycan-associated lipoprotein
MKSIKWIMPLVVASVLVVSGCSQQTVKPANAANRLTTGNAVGAGVSRNGTSNRLGVSTSGNALGRGGASSSFGRTTSSSFGNGRGTSARGASTSGIGGSLISNGFGNNRAAGGGRLGSGSLSGGSASGDTRLGSNGLDNRIGGSGGGDYKVTDLNDPSSVLSRRVIYFAYDQSTIEPEYFEILDAHSELLASNPNLTIRLEGHADERGSREYNIALSERRAQSVKQFMDLKGVGSGQSQTVAYGEELPVDPGHNEAAWSKNRRVEIKYIGR